MKLIEFIRSISETLATVTAQVQENENVDFSHVIEKFLSCLKEVFFFLQDYD